MARHAHGAPPHVHEDVGVQRHHDDEGEQVEDGPEHQVGVAVERRHVGAGVQAADAVPAGAGDGAHHDGQRPDDDDHHHHAPVAHARVQLHAEDGDVALDGDGQQVGHRGGERRVDEPLAQQPGGHGEAPRVGPRVEHQVEVRQPREEVGRRQVGHQVVDGEVEAAVDVDGHHDQQVGQHDEHAHADAQAHDQLADRVPLAHQELLAAVVEELDALVVEALLLGRHHGCLGEQRDRLETDGLETELDALVVEALLLGRHHGCLGEQRDRLETDGLGTDRLETDRLGTELDALVVEALLLGRHHGCLGEQRDRLETDRLETELDALVDRLESDR